ANAAVGEVSESGLGQHTTTSAQLFHFPTGGALIDSPGVREFGLWHIESEQLINGFVEFLPFIGQCKFRDCKHQKEPGCALKAALENQAISASRWQNYFAILDTLSTKPTK
ncbi:MAG TPA: ribosome small subunit-dependent GTPase A, partial [Pseudomonadales bacterium]|nr:ribosome small subunit-dependent GTPase A [Pseudomonadales bacterium]